jgi:hypothetical protein
MNLEAAIPDGAYGHVRIQLYNQEGHRIWRSGWLNSESARRNAEHFLAGPDLTFGTWEVDLVTSFNAVQTSHCDLDVSFAGFETGPRGAWATEHKAGELPTGSFSLSTRLDRPFHGRAEATVLGFTRTRKVKTDSDTFEHKFKLTPQFAGVRFRLTLDPIEFGRFTDLAANVLDSEGRALIQDGLSYPFWTATFDNPDPDRAGSKEYTLQLAGGLADSADGTGWSFELREEYLWADPVGVTIKREDNTEFSVYPGVTVDLDYELEKTPTVAPKGYGHFGEIRLIDANSGEVLDRLPVAWDFRR